MVCASTAANAATALSRFWGSRAPTWWRRRRRDARLLLPGVGFPARGFSGFIVVRRPVVVVALDLSFGARLAGFLVLLASCALGAGHGLLAGLAVAGMMGWRWGARRVQRRVACAARGGEGNRVGSAAIRVIGFVRRRDCRNWWGAAQVGGRRPRRQPSCAWLPVRAPAAGPVRGALRLSPPQVLELDEVPPLVLELHARAAPAAEEGWEKRGGKKGQWSMFGGALVRRGAIRRGTDARARVNSAGSRRDAGSVARRGV